MSTHNFEEMAANMQDPLLLKFEAGDFEAELSSPLAFASPGLYTPSPPGTVSPKDLTFPPSATYTEMSTPSFASSFASPGTYSQNPSPMFQDVDAQFWDDPLFGDSTALLESPLNEVHMTQALGGRFAMSPPPKPVASKASPVSATGTAKISSVAGVTKRAASKPLPPVQFDPSDSEAARRARNTEAARKSRAKKAAALEEAQREAEEAKLEAAELKKQLAERDAELACLKAQLGL